jgi:hypothetical protein
MKKHFFLIVFYFIFLIPNNNFAQTDTLLIGFQNSLNNFDIRKVEITDNNNYFLWSRFQQSVFYITDLKGNILHQKESIIVDTIDLNNISCIGIENNEFFFIGDVKIQGKLYNYWAKSDTALNNFEIIDTVSIDPDVNTFYYKIKKNIIENNYYSIGYISNSNNQPIAHCFLKFDLNTNKLTYKKLHNETSPVLDFYYDYSNDNYFISSFGSKDYLYDENLNQLWSGKLEFSFVDSGITEKMTIYVWDTEESETGEPDILHTFYPFGTSFDQGLGKLTFFSDSVALKTMIPLNENHNSLMKFNTKMAKDKNGDYVVMGINGYQFTSGATIPNVLTVAKYSKNFEKIWENQLNLNCSFYPRDLKIDQNNDILIVGEGQNVLNDDLIYGFLLKMYADGNLTIITNNPIDFNEIKVNFSNPFGQVLYISNRAMTAFKFELFDNLGKKVLSKDIHESEENVDVEFLASGNYYYQLFQKGQLIQTGKLIRI